jgi:hypothetical protein
LNFDRLFKVDHLVADPRPKKNCSIKNDRFSSGEQSAI